MSLHHYIYIKVRDLWVEDGVRLFCANDFLEEDVRPYFATILSYRQFYWCVLVSVTCLYFTSVPTVVT